MMNKSCLFIIGLPGSGKTFLGKKLSKERKALFIDDPKTFSNVESDIVVADPSFCNPEIREKAKKIVESNGFTVEFLFFENDPVQCRKNVELRVSMGDFRKVDNAITVLTKIYVIPEKVNVIPVYKGN